MFEEANFRLGIKMLEKHIRGGDWKSAVDFYHSAVITRPNNPYLRAYAERINEESGQDLIPIRRTQLITV